jgi:hypothetical protein
MNFIIDPKGMSNSIPKTTIPNIYDDTSVKADVAEIRNFANKLVLRKDSFSKKSET